MIIAIEIGIKKGRTQYQKRKTDHSPKKTTLQEEPEKIEPVEKERKSRTQDQCVCVCMCQTDIMQKGPHWRTGPVNRDKAAPNSRKTEKRNKKEKGPKKESKERGPKKGGKSERERGDGLQRNPDGGDGFSRSLSRREREREKVRVPKEPEPEEGEPRFRPEDEPFRG